MFPVCTGTRKKGVLLEFADSATRKPGPRIEYLGIKQTTPQDSLRTTCSSRSETWFSTFMSVAKRSEPAGSRLKLTPGPNDMRRAMCNLDLALSTSTFLRL